MALEARIRELQRQDARAWKEDLRAPTVHRAAVRIEELMSVLSEMRASLATARDRLALATDPPAHHLMDTVRNCTDDVAEAMMSVVDMCDFVAEHTEADAR